MKKSPRLFKIIKVADTLELMFQIKEHANEFIDLLENEIKNSKSLEKLIVKLTDQSKNSTKENQDS